MQVGGFSCVPIPEIRGALGQLGESMLQAISNEIKLWNLEDCAFLPGKLKV